MKPSLTCAALAVLLVPLGAVRAADAAATGSTPAAFVLPMTTGLAPAVSDGDTADGAVTASGFTVTGRACSPAEGFLAEVSAVAPAPFHSTYVAGVRYESARYRPRRARAYRDRSYARVRGATQLHAGYLDPDGPPDPGFLAGFRVGQQFEDVVEVGFGADWRNKSGRSTEVLQSSTGPGGEVILVRRELSRYSSNLFPLMAYLQVSGPSSLALIPYVGVAASYQALFLSADDFQSGLSFDATYDGFGWQLWGGARFPLSGRTGLLGEVFVNNAELDRDVFDAATGETIREIVSTDGVGARFGLSWGF